MENFLRIVCNIGSQTLQFFLFSDEGAMPTKCIAKEVTVDVK